MMRSEPTAGTISAYGPASFVTTVYESGAVTSNFFPPTFSRSWIEGCSVSSYATSNENNTSSAVMGCPSENAAPCRRCQVHVRPSPLVSQDRASIGPSCWVALLKSARVVNIRSVTSVVEVSFPMMALKVFGPAVWLSTNRPP